MILMGDPSFDSRIHRETAALTQDGWAVTLLCMGPVASLPASLPAAKVKAIDLVTRRFFGRSGRFVLAKYTEATLRMLGLALKLRSRVCHCHDIETLPIGIILKLLKHSYVVYDSHELHLERSGQGRLLRRVKYFLEWVGARLVDVVIMSDGESRIRHFQHTYKVRSTQVIDIGNYPDVPLSLPERSLKVRLGIPSDDRLVVYVGRIGPGRGVEKIVPLMKEFSGIHYVLLGAVHPSYRESILQLAERIGVRDRLEFLPPVTPAKVAETIVGADVGLCLIENASLSYYYSRPTKLFEYMAAGVPVIASRFPEMVKSVLGFDNRPAGWVVDPERTEDLRAVLHEIVHNPDRVVRYGKNAREYSTSRFSWARAGDELKSLYARFDTGYHEV